MRTPARRFTATGHLIDSGLMTRALNLVLEAGGDYEVVSFVMGRTRVDESSIELDVRADTAPALEALAARLVDLGLWDRAPGEARLEPAPADSCVPDEFYATTNRRTDVFLDGAWREVADMRMDGVIVAGPEGPRCRLLRDVRRGDRVVCTNRAVRIRAIFRESEGEEFGFMASDVSSERSVSVAVRRVADELVRLKRGGGRVIVVAGPVVVHTGGGPALAALVRDGYVSGVLAGNALAVHDIESALYGTSLGIDLASGLPAREGHRNHLRAINAVFRHGSIADAVEDRGDPLGCHVRAGARRDPVRARGVAARRRPAARDRDGHAEGPGPLRRARARGLARDPALDHAAFHRHGEHAPRLGPHHLR